MRKLVVLLATAVGILLVSAHWIGNKSPIAASTMLVTYKQSQGDPWQNSSLSLVEIKGNKSWWFDACPLVFLQS